MPADNADGLSRAVLFANGLIFRHDRLQPWVRSGDYLVGVDGGTRHCLDMGHTPDVVVGDLDSLDPEAQAEIQKRAVPILQFPVRKDCTDLDLAMLHVAEQGIREAILLGMWGGRLDQSVANLLLLTQYMDQLDITVVTEDETVQILGPGQSLTVENRERATASILPLSAQVEGVKLSGMEYPLDNALLPFGTTLGISNVVRQKQASVSIRRGLLLVTVSHND